MTKHIQDEIHQLSLQSPEEFWMKQANHLTWYKKPSRALQISSKKLKDGTTHPHWTWFPDGEISTCYNCVDRHVEAGNGDNLAIVWESPVTGQKEQYTYKELQLEVAILAGVLREEQVKQGDVVLIYMPMIPAALIGMLAVNRIGAIHAVVFGGFSAPALAQRIQASKPKAILTASCGIEPKKAPIGYQTMVEEAIKESTFTPHKTIIWQRDQLRWNPVKRENGQRNWQRLVKSGRNRGLRADCTPIKSSDGVYIIYTSGTTGTPKGIIREAAGHAVGLNLSIRYLFGIRPGEVIFTASDIGWVSRD
jgi:propionyl-CoA synthetase